MKYDMTTVTFVIIKHYNNITLYQLKFETH